MSKVRIVQVLCPSRHCIVATAYESPDGEELPKLTERLRKQVEDLMAAGNMNPWCGLCNSRQWTYEDRATAYATIAEALPALAETERRNAATREYFRASRG